VPWLLHVAVVYSVRVIDVQEAAARRKSFEDELQRLVGFRVVIDALQKSDAVVVGHNCFLDLLHVTHKFVAPLPQVRSLFCTCCWPSPARASQRLPSQ
jgi:hypothetical protein